MLESLFRLSPLETEYTQALFDQFDGITRAVVTATLLSASSRAVGGRGYYAAGLDSCSVDRAQHVADVGAVRRGGAGFSVPACLWLFAVEGRTTAAVVSGSLLPGGEFDVDNIVKPWCCTAGRIFTRLLALLSVIGGHSGPRSDRDSRRPDGRGLPPDASEYGPRGTAETSAEAARA